MAEKDDAPETSKAESINDMLFASFDPEEEMTWLVGGSTTRKITINGSPQGPDGSIQYDWTT